MEIAQRYRRNLEITHFALQWNNNPEDIYRLAESMLEGTLVDPGSLVNALEFMIWGDENREFLALQCDSVSDIAAIKRTVERLLGPPNKRMSLINIYEGTSIIVSTIGTGDFDNIKEEDLFYVGTSEGAQLARNFGIEPQRAYTKEMCESRIMGGLSIQDKEILDIYLAGGIELEDALRLLDRGRE